MYRDEHVEKLVPERNGEWFPFATSGNPHAGVSGRSGKVPVIIGSFNTKQLA